MTSARDMLKAVVDRIERLHEERKALSEDIRDVYAEAKANGFDVKALKIVIQRRAKDSDALSELDAMVETYEAHLGTETATRVHAHESAPLHRAVPSELPDIPPELDRRAGAA